MKARIILDDLITEGSISEEQLEALRRWFDKCFPGHRRKDESSD